MAGQADVDRIGLNESRGLPGVRIVASGAVALRAWMLNFCFLDLLGLLTVAGHAYGFGIGLRQDDLAVLRCGVAGVALPAGKRRMRVGLHQLRLRRLVRIVALYAVGGGERLSLVRLDQVRRSRIVTVEAQRRARLGQVIIELLFALLANLVGDVAGVAAHIQRRVPAAFLGNVDALVMAGEAEVLCLVSRRRLQELILVVGLMRIMALQAIANRRGMNCPVKAGGVHIGVAGNAERLRSGGDQLYAGDVFINPDLVTARTSGGDGRVDVLAFCFVLVTLDAFGGVGVLAAAEPDARPPESKLAPRTRPSTKIDRKALTAASS